MGIDQNQLIFDPGIGFGKTAEQSMILLRHIPYFKKYGLPILVGHSRKSFLNIVTPKAFHERDLESAIVSQMMAREGVEYLRVHDVASNLQALKIQAHLQGVHV